MEEKGKKAPAAPRPDQERGRAPGSDGSSTASSLLRYGAVQEEPGGGQTRRPRTEGVSGIATGQREAEAASPEHGGSNVAAAARGKEEKGKGGGAADSSSLRSSGQEGGGGGIGTQLIASGIESGELEAEAAPPEHGRSNAAAAERGKEEKGKEGGAHDSASVRSSGQEGGGGAIGTEVQLITSGIESGEVEAEAAPPEHVGSAGAGVARGEDVEAYRQPQRGRDRLGRILAPPSNRDNVGSSSTTASSSSRVASAATLAHTPAAGLGIAAAAAGPGIAAAGPGIAAAAAPAQLPPARTPSHKQKLTEVREQLHGHLLPQQPMMVSDDATFMQLAVEIQNRRQTNVNFANLTGEPALRQVLPPGTNFGRGKLGLHKAARDFALSHQQQPPPPPPQE